MKYFIGIDVSTTATKSLLMDEAGRVVAVAASEYTFETPRPLWSEQDANLWWQGTIHSIRSVFAESGIEPRNVAGIGLTGQMHGLTMLGGEGKVLRPAILWNDQRTESQCDEIRTRLGRRRLIEITGNDALTGFTAPKILWVREHQPEIYQKTHCLLLPKDYVRYKLTGVYATDKAGAAGTLLMDMHLRDWSQEVLDALEIPVHLLPKTHEGTQVTGEVSSEAADSTGLAAGTPVVGGGGDQSAQAVGVGAVKPGVVALTLGTSGVVFASTDQPMIEPEGRLHAFCHAAPGKWHMMGVMLSAAGSLRWHRDTLAPGEDYSVLVSEAEGVSPGCEGLYFLPYLTGERTPHPDPLARAGFIGLTVRHARPHMTRAVLEGVAFGLRDGFELMKKAGLAEITQVRISGGGAKSELWRQILADVLDAQLVTVNTTEGAAYGAALLAGVGAGIWPDVDTACELTIHLTGTTQPQVDNVPIYQGAYRTYRKLYPALKEIFQGS